MNNTIMQIWTLAAKEISDTWRTRLLFVITAFMLGAGLVALVVAAVALKAEVVSYYSAREFLLSMGKPADLLAPPAFLPLSLLRGFIEYVEIIGAVLGIILGHRAATYERSCSTMPLLLTRPLSKATLFAGKILGNLSVLTSVLILMFALGAVGIGVIGGVSLSANDLARIAVTLAAAVLYVGLFFLLGFLLALVIRRPAHAMLLAFGCWLTFTLIAPQIGDTLDPDNQVGSGVFRTLGIPKPQELQIMKSFSTYETLRDAVEQSSPAKHFERWSFAALGIKETYTGQPLASVMKDRRTDAFWLIGLFGTFLTGLFLLPLKAVNLTKE